MQSFKMLIAFLFGILLSGHATGQLTITASSGTTSCDSPSHCINVLADGFSDISIFQYSMGYDSDYFTFDQVTSPFHTALFWDNDAALGEVAFSWFEFPVMTNLPAGSLLYTICFQPTGLSGNTSVDFIDGTNTPIQFADGNNNLLVENVDFSFTDATVIVEDNEDPLITCPTDTLVTIAAGSSIMDLAPVAFSDNCQIDNVSYAITGVTSGSGANDASGEAFNAGLSTVTYTITDSGTNNASCSFEVELINNSTNFQFIPNIEVNCDADTIELCVAANNFTDVVGLQVPILWDTATLSYVSTDVHLPQTSTVAEGGIANGIMAFFYNASPALPNGLSIPNGDTMFCTTFAIEGPLNTPLFTFMDIPGLPITINEDPTYDILPENYGTIDTTDPSFANCPSDTTIMTGTACSAIYTWSGPTAMDDCIGMPTVDSTHASGSSFPIGTTTVTYTVTDLSGNQNTCAFNVTVVENEDPIITCPMDTVIESAVPIAVNDLLPTATDNCGMPTVTFDLTDATTGSGGSDASGTVFNLGMTTVTYTATDDSGNSHSCDFTVEINAPDLPQIDCPADTSVATTSANCFAVLNDIAPTLISNPINVDSISYSSIGATTVSGLNDASGESFNEGVTTLTYTIVDLLGNSNSCDFVITVIDTIPPAVTCQGLDAFENELGACGLTVNNNLNPVTSDACGIQSVDYVFSGATSGSGSGDPTGTFFNAGITLITFTVTDVNGNSSMCTTQVWINDSEPPSVNCPTDTLITIAAPNTSALVNGIDPISIDDNCAPPPPAVSFAATGATTIATTIGTASGQSFNVGLTEVTYYVTDTTGNVDSCKFNVTIELGLVDLLDCPMDTVLSNDTLLCGALVNGIGPNLLVPIGQIQSIDYIIDGATMATGTLDASGTLFNTNISTVKYIVEDINGNLDSCTFTVTVNDTELPTWTNCPDTVFSYTLIDNCVGIGVWSSPIPADNCGVINLNSSHATGDTFPLGSSTVTYSAEDAAGNIGLCEFIVFVQDTIAPTIVSCATDTLVYAVADCQTMVSWDVPVAIDSCGSPIISSSHSPGDIFPVGTTIVTYNFMDGSGNVDSCQFNVEVVDTLAPFLACPAQLVLSIDGTIITDDLGLITNTSANANCDSVLIDFTLPAAADGCDGSTTVFQIAGTSSGSNFNIGTTTVIFTTSDASGNSVDCSFDIMVMPLSDVALSITDGDEACEGATVQFNIDNPVTGATYSWTGPEGWTATGTNPERPAISLTQGGTYTVVCNLAGGCTTTGSIDLTVNAAPNITASSNSPVCSDGTGSLLLMAEEINGQAVASWSWTGPSFTSMDQNPEIINSSAANAGTYTVTATLANGCSATASTEVIVANIVTPNLATDCDEVICLGENCTILGSEFVNATVEYIWQVAPAATAGIIGNTDQSTISIEPTAAGIYVITYSAIVDGCPTGETTIAITVEGEPIANEDTFAVPYETTLEFGSLLNNDEFNAELGFTIAIDEIPEHGVAFINAEGQLTYIPEAGYVGQDQFTYELCNNCSGNLCNTGQITVNVEFDGECEVPTVITPNQDGYNDMIIINCLLSGNYPTNSFAVYNLWGDRVFFASPYNNNWSGTWDGKDLPDGTYYYIFMESESSDPDKGHITLTR